MNPNYIQKVSAKGLTSADFEHQLGRVTVFTGDSTSGKTSHSITAIRLGLIGYIPELGKTKSSTMQLARNGSLDVKITDNLGRLNHRVWDKSTTKANEGIPPTPPVLIDHNEYTSLSDPKKVEYVFSMCPMDENEEFTGPGVSAKIKNLRFDENTKETEEEIRKLVSLVDETDIDRHHSGRPVQEWIEELLFTMNTRLKAAKVVENTMTGTVRGITALAVDAPPPMNRESEIARERAKIEEVNGRIGALTQRLTTKREKVARSEDLRGFLSLSTDDVGELRLRLKMANDELEERSKREIPASETTDIEARIAELEAKINAHVPCNLSAEVAKINAEVAKHRAERDAHAEKFEERQKETAKHLECKSCPLCTSVGEEWKVALRKWWKEWADNAEAVRKSYERRDKIDRKHLLEINARVDAEEKAKIEVQEHRRQLEIHRKDLEAIKTKAATLVADAQDEVTMIQGEAKRLQGLIDDAQSKSEQRSGWRTEQEQILAWLSTNTDSEFDLAKMKADLAGYQAEARRLDGLQKEWLNAKADEQRNAQALIQQQKCAAEILVTKAAIEEVEKIRATMVATAFSQILIPVNRITAGILASPIEYRTVDDVGQIGRWEGSTWITHVTFSGIEKALTYVGIAAALAASAPVRVIMIDELGIFDPRDSKTLGKLLKRMVALTEAGEIGQFIGTIAGELKNPPEGVTVIEL